MIAQLAGVLIGAAVGWVAGAWLGAKERARREHDSDALRMLMEIFEGKESDTDKDI